MTKNDKVYRPEDPCPLPKHEPKGTWTEDQIVRQVVILYDFRDLDQLTNFVRKVARGEIKLK